MASVTSFSGGSFLRWLSLAILYILLGADFLGISQVLVYAGGVLVLIIFGIFLTTPHVDELGSARKSIATWITIGFGFLLFRLLAKMILQMPWVTKIPQSRPTINSIGNLFLSKYLLPFELISVVLLFVLIGSILIIRKDLRR
ncbi:MAG: NADH-quinone oxidoreductase subunit J [Bdellovibrionota bacterium]